MVYRYFMTQRPAGPGAQPKEGLVNIIDLDPNKVIPHIKHHAYALLEYDRPLSEKEQYNYELLPDVAMEDVQYRGYVIEWCPFNKVWRVYRLGEANSTIAFVDSVEEAKSGLDRYLGKPEKEG